MAIKEERAVQWTVNGGRKPSELELDRLAELLKDVARKRTIASHVNSAESARSETADTQ